MTTTWLFDGSLGLLILVLGAATLYARTLYTAVVLYIVFGLLLALAWARLGAPDLALAEAAIGAGLTGVLMLAALARMGTDRPVKRNLSERLSTGLFSLAVLGLLMIAVWPLPEGEQIVSDAALSAMPESGVGHPVTAVLLNFRSWDTLLELLVVLFALLGVRQLSSSALAIPEPWPLLQAWARLLAPLAVLLGGYLLWRGTSAPGGAFQAGALLAAGAVMLRMTQMLPPLSWQNLWVRILVLVGVALFLSVGVITYVSGYGFLTYPPDWSYRLILVIEIAATLSIATTLTMLVISEKAELRP